MFLNRSIPGICALLLFIRCLSPEYTNPYDPEGDKPLPLAPQNVSLTAFEDKAVCINFEYEYDNGAKIKIERNEIVIAIMSSGTEVYDYWELSEDVSMKYRLGAYNDFGSTQAPTSYFKNKVAPRITIASSIKDKDTVSFDKIVMSGTVWDSSDVRLLTITDAFNEDTVTLYKQVTGYKQYSWNHTVNFEEGKNIISIYSQDKSSCKSDTTINVTVYYLSSLKNSKPQALSTGD